MPRSRLVLCWFYAAVALLALVGTWSQNVAYFRGDEGAVARERRLAARGQAAENLGFTNRDTMALVALGAVMGCFTLWTVVR